MWPLLKKTRKFCVSSFGTAMKQPKMENNTKKKHSYHKILILLEVKRNLPADKTKALLSTLITKIRDYTANK